jgi:hypothetical protein
MRLGGSLRGRARLVPVPVVITTSGQRPVGCVPVQWHFRATRPPLRPVAVGYRIFALVMWAAATVGLRL